MDYEKLNEVYKKKFESLKFSYNMDNYETHNGRKGFPILDEISIHDFKPRIDKYKATVDELRELLKKYLIINRKEDAFCFFLYSCIVLEF